MPRHFTDEHGNEWSVRESSVGSEGHLYVEFANLATGERRGGNVGKNATLGGVPDAVLGHALEHGYVKCRKCGQLAAPNAQLCYTHKSEEQRKDIPAVVESSVKSSSGGLATFFGVLPQWARSAWVGYLLSRTRLQPR